MSIARLREVRALCWDLYNRCNAVLEPLEERAREMQAADADDALMDMELAVFPGWLTPLPSRQTGTLRRRTMDLTRALADLRRP